MDAFELCYWRRLLRVPWTARRSNQSILKESSPEFSLEGLMVKLKLQNFGHLMQRADSLEKTLMLGKIEGRRRRGQHRMRCWMASPTQWTWVWASCGSWWWTGKPGMLQPMGSQRVRHDLLTKEQILKYTVIYQLTQSRPTLRDCIDCSTPGFPVHHQIPELAQIHVHQVSDAIQPSCPLPSPSSPAFNPSQLQDLF